LLQLQKQHSTVYCYGIIIRSKLFVIVSSEHLNLFTVSEVMTLWLDTVIIIIMLHQMHEIQAVAADVPVMCVCLEVCLSVNASAPCTSCRD